MNWRDELTSDEAARLDELYAARRASQDEINRIAKRCRKRMERRNKAWIYRLNKTGTGNG